MRTLFSAVGSLILGISVIQLANGYIGTLVSIRLAIAQVEPVIAGTVTAAYFAGYAAGAVLCHRLINRAGHIRAFTAFAAVAAAAFLVLPLYFDPILWAAMRGLAGFGCAGLYMATESWLNVKSTAATRGKVFAIYMIATYATFAGGQFILNLASPMGFALFVLAAILFCAALVIVATTRAEQPPPPVQISRLKIGELAIAAPVAVAGCLVGGLVNGAFYALIPVYAQARGFSVLQISTYMALAIAGGLLMQLPMGWLSDRFDRRLVVGIAASLFAALSLMTVPARGTAVFPLVWLLLGGFMAVIYPICVAHANDRMPAERAVTVSGRLILISGIGSAIGPLIGGSVLATFDFHGLFYFMAAMAVLFALFALARGLSVGGPASQHRRPFVVMRPVFAHDLAHAPDERKSTPAS